MAALSSSDAPSNGIISRSWLLLEDYDQTNHGTASVESCLKTIQFFLDPSNKTERAARIFHLAVKLLDKYPSANTQPIHDLLKNPAQYILEDKRIFKIYQRLFVRCLHAEIRESIQYFKNALSLEAVPNFQDEIAQKHARVCAIAIPCFGNLNKATQQEMKDVLQLLGNQPESTFTNPLRLRVFKITAQIFADLNTSSNGPLEDSASEDDFDSEPNPDQPEANAADTGASAAAAAAAAASSPPMMTASFVCPDDVLKAIREYSPPNAQRKGMESRLEQYKSISHFGKAFLLDYGPKIIERASKALIEALNIPEQREQFVNLVLNVAAPQLLSTSDPSSNSQAQAAAEPQKPAAPDPFSCKIFELIRSSLKKRMPDLIRDMVKYTTKALKDPQDGPELVKLAMDYVTPLCFQPTLSSPDFKKNLLITLLNSVNLFLADLNSSLDEMSKTQREPLDPKSEELILVHLMNKRVKMKGLPVIVPDHLNDAAMKANMRCEIEKLLKAFMSSEPDNPASFSPKQNILLFILSLYMFKVVDSIFSPDTLCILIDRLLENPLSLASNVNPPTEKLEGNLNKAYTNTLSVLMHGMIVEAMKMGGTPIFFRTLLDIIDPIIKSKLNNAAFSIHKNLEEIMRTPFLSDTVITPVLIFDHLLYDKTKPAADGEKPQRIPAFNMINFLSDSPPDVESIRSRVNKNIKTKPYANIQELINANVSMPARLALKSLPIESFCQNLTNRLYRLSQQEMLMKILVGYLTHGLTKMIQQQKPPAK